MKLYITRQVWLAVFLVVTIYHLLFMSSLQTLMTEAFSCQHHLCSDEKDWLNLEFVVTQYKALLFKDYSLKHFHKNY